MNSSQGTDVAARETRTSPSAQDEKTNSIDRPDDGRNQISAGETSDHVVLSGADTNGHASSFTDELKRYQEKLDHDFHGYEQDLHDTNPAQTSIADFDWDQLELDYQKQVGEVAMKEREVMSQFDARFKQFMLWMQVSDERESQRAIKRLKTQSAYVQNSEAELARKELHYASVMEAFQNAMSLLNRHS